MTSIWDTLGLAAWVESMRIDGDLVAEDHLKAAMQAIANTLIPRKEYNTLYVYVGGKQIPFKEALQSLLDNYDVNVAHEIIQTLHDFDHMDIPMHGRRTYGHHTENVLILRQNRKYLRIVSDNLEYFRRGC